MFGLYCLHNGTYYNGKRQIIQYYFRRAMFFLLFLLAFPEGCASMEVIDLNVVLFVGTAFLKNNQRKRGKNHGKGKKGKSRSPVH